MTAARMSVSRHVARRRVSRAARGGAARCVPRVPCTNTVGGSPRTNQRARTCALRTPGGTHHQGCLTKTECVSGASWWWGSALQRPPGAATAPTSLTSGPRNEQYKCGIWRPRAPPCRHPAQHSSTHRSGVVSPGRQGSAAGPLWGSSLDSRERDASPCEPLTESWECSRADNAQHN
nr:uncharacterized protein LOC110377960 [Helicoverpa armigera]